MRDRNYIPKATMHRSGQAVVRLNGKDYYLGSWKSAAAKAEYERLITEWLAGGRRLPDAETGLTVNDAILAYDKFAEVYYQASGTKAGPLVCIRDALRMVKRLYGRTPAAEFGPKKLKAVRQAMLERDWCRNYVNAQVDRVRRMFRWAVSEELVPGEVYHALQAVPGIRKGTLGVRESRPVKPVPQAAIEASRSYLAEPVIAMVDLQLFTGMRPGEAVVMRGCDLEMSGRVWIYRPAKHKTEHLDKTREIYVGPKGQEIIKPFLRLDTQAYLFSPAESEDARNAERRRNRKTPMTPSQAKRKPKRNRERAPKDRYTVASYRKAIERACQRAFPLPDPLGQMLLPSSKLESVRAWKARLTDEEKEAIRAWRAEHTWHPHQLRHNAGTNLRKEFGVELARIILGHATAFTTEIYAEADRQQAIEVIAKIG
jgi:integrase